MNQIVLAFLVDKQVQIRKNHEIWKKTKDNDNRKGVYMNNEKNFGKL
jgi:hypothetical protein